MSEIKPCPFCGKEVGYYICDSEGNLKDEDYLEDPWSGIGYQIRHEMTDGVECPIATHEFEGVGALIYESLDELAKFWNSRS